MGGGVEDGVDNSGVSKEKLYSTPEDVYKVWQGLSPISEKFTIAAAFGNVHGVYKSGNVKLQPQLLANFQKFVSEKVGQENPLFFVFHGGSGSEKHDIATALGAGVVKMNVDTDTQWAYWEGVKNFYQAKEGYLQGQIGNPEGPEKPNKSYYDPRKWLREAELTMVKSHSFRTRSYLSHSQIEANLAHAGLNSNHVETCKTNSLRPHSSAREAVSSSTSRSYSFITIRSQNKILCCYP